MNTSDAPTHGTTDCPIADTVDTTVGTPTDTSLDTSAHPIMDATAEDMKDEPVTDEPATDLNDSDAEAEAAEEPVALYGPAADVLAEMAQHADPERAAQMTRYHKQTRKVLGVSNEIINTLCKPLRAELDLADRVALAQGLWQSDVFEARLMAAKLLTQARIKDDATVWDLLSSWVADFDSLAIAEQTCSAISKRLIAAPERLENVAEWTSSDHRWTRIAALMATLPWAKLPNPKPHELDARDRILGWAAGFVSDNNLFIQKTIAIWLRDLSKHDAARATAFLLEHGPNLKPVARKEALRHLPNVHIAIPTPPPAPVEDPAKDPLDDGDAHTDVDTAIDTADQTDDDGQNT